MDASPLLPPPPRRAGVVANVMTIDVEDYFHVSAFDAVVSRDEWPTRESRVEANTERLLAIFSDAGVRGTFFILGWVAERVPALVRRIAAAGHEVASHSHWHRLVYDLTPEAFREDLRRARGLIEDAAGAPVRGFRAPSYSVTERSLWALDVLIEEGYAYDASIFPIRHDRYGIPSAPRHPHRITRQTGSIVEVPGTTALAGPVKVPIGGGYFRLVPYAVTRWAIARINETEGRPAMFYLHPWEIDPAQPRLPAARVTRWRHYNNLEHTEARLRSLIRDFRWCAIADAVTLDADAGAPRLGRSAPGEAGAGGFKSPEPPDRPGTAQCGRGSAA